MSNKIFYTFLNSFVGKAGIASSSAGIVCVDIRTKEKYFLEKLKRTFPENRLVKSEKMDRKAIDELTSYLKGNLKVFNSQLDLRGTPFQLNVWENTRKIPYGKIRPYKFVACKLGKPTASRAVGNAIAQNPIPIFVPCHRVIKADGSLGCYGPGEDIKIKLLKLEGAIQSDNLRKSDCMKQCVVVRFQHKAKNKE